MDAMAFNREHHFHCVCIEFDPIQLTKEMISRKKIISKSEDSSSSSSSSSSSTSSDNLYKDDPYTIHDDPYVADIEDEDDENAWINIDQLVNDQLEEIRNKWNQIDDEIWAKIICFERNRRVAKAYARSQVISITGSDRGFDGYRIGLNGFPNPKRDYEVQIIKQQIRSGFKLKIDDLGNIHIKRVGRCPVFSGTSVQEQEHNHHHSMSDDDNEDEDDQRQINNSYKNQRFTALEFNKPRIIFDFKKFQNSMLTILSSSSSSSSTASSRTQKSRNVLHANNDHQHQQLLCSRLQNQCVHFIQLAMDEEERLLRHPCWILLINIVALDLFWSKFKPNTSIITRKLLAPNEANINLRRLKPKNPLYDPCVEDYQDEDHDLYYCGYMAKISNNFGRGNGGAGKNDHNSPSPFKSATKKLPERMNMLEMMIESKINKSSNGNQIPNPMKQLPTFNRIGLEKSKRLFFSSHQLSLPCEPEIGGMAASGVEESTKQKQPKINRYLSNTNGKHNQHHHHHHHLFSQTQARSYHHHSNKYSKLNQRMKQTYRSTSDLLSN